MKKLFAALALTSFLASAVTMAVLFIKVLKAVGIGAYILWSAIIGGFAGLGLLFTLLFGRAMETNDQQNKQDK